ncbi:MAG TPA: ABC-F family ATP-binding cassette domain-containing protein [Vicinamibacterales bacterium]|nr:ABC-F family ATP-binding cassette domain-containing protein [Vicinamibacterales bacterium]
MIQLSELTKAFGDRVLFDRVTWQITDRERVGLCGPNGAGKTTLMRMMAGLDEPDAGAILKPSSLTVGYLPQDGLVHTGRTVFDEASSAFDKLLSMKAEMHALEERLGDDSIPAAEHDAMLHRYSDLQERFRLDEGYSIELKSATVLQGLGFKTSDFDRQTDTFSGGWQMRLALAKLLLGRPNLLLLDEPTNHLDLEARNWLEEYLNEYPHAVILVSHDRFFLDSVVTRIADLTLRTLTDYVGNYSRYLTEHQARIEALRKAKREQDEEVARIKLFVDRFRYQATKAAQVQSRVKLLEKVVPIEVPLERKKIHFDFPACAKSGRAVIELKQARKKYGELVVFKSLDLHVERGDRIALVGPNGVGKSTLMRLLSGEEAPDTGQRTLGHNVVMQYFAQDEATRVDGYSSDGHKAGPTVYDTLASGSPLHMVPAIRNILGGFLFSGDDVYKPVRVLSGGERTRLAVARMLLRPSNTLLLDEPTNHLDLDSKEVLLDALADYGGTLVFVSHDRYFVEKLATKIVEVGSGEAIVYPGTYTEFLWRKEHGSPAGAATISSITPGASQKGAREAIGAPNTPSRTAPAKATRPKSAPNPAREEKKRDDAEARRRAKEAQARRTRVEQLEARIAECETEIREIELTMATPGFYDDRAAAQPVIDRHQALMWRVGDLMHEWEELQTVGA